MTISTRSHPETPAVGSRVGAARWPYAGSHPDAWIEPHQGVVLARNDLAVWAGSARFPGTPTQAEVDAHVAWAEGEGVLAGVPVRWDFGAVMWEPVASLRSAEDDLAAWQAARTAAYAAREPVQPARSVHRQ